MDKIKDFLYGISDIILGVIVFILILWIFAYQLGGWFGFNILNPFSSDRLSESAIEKYEEVSEASKPETETPVETNNVTLPEATTQEAITTTPEESAVTTTPPQTTEAEITITIPSGSSSDQIAEILFTSGAISSKEDFLKIIVERSLETRLQAGDFTIPAGSGLDTVIAIITR